LPESLFAIARRRLVNMAGAFGTLEETAAMTGVPGLRSHSRRRLHERDLATRAVVGDIDRDLARLVDGLDEIERGLHDGV
jgi:hypothetical protein